MIPVYLEEARLELLDATAWYEECQKGLGRRFYKEVEGAEEAILQNPEFCRDVGCGCRRKILSRFPYGSIYRLRNDLIEIVAVMHLHREPGYWGERGG